MCFLVNHPLHMCCVYLEKFQIENVPFAQRHSINTHRGLFYFPKIITLHNTHPPHPSYHLATLTPTPPGWDLDELRRSSRIHNGNPSMAPNDILRRNRNSPHHHRRNTTHTRNDVHGPRRTRPLIPC